MSNHSIKTRAVALLLSFLLCLSLTGCGDKSNEETTEAQSESISTDKGKVTKEKSNKKEDKKENKKDDKTDSQIVEENESQESNQSSNTDTSNKSETTTKPINPTPATAKSPQGSTSLKPVEDGAKAQSPKDSGLSNKASAVENASTAEQIANVAPEQAAQSSYDTEVEVKQMETPPAPAEEFPLLKSNQFESHIKSVWSNFQVTDKVKISPDDLNEYLNYVCLPLKESFFEINCDGYSCRYAYDQDHKYILVEVNWSYYINASQYATCKSKAQSIVNSTSSYGSTINRIRAIHDIICKNTTYVENVDGAYNCLVNGRCDCDGYTAAFQLCMDLLGVPCKAYATSNHIFNLVQMSGNWYATDVTWDDQEAYGLTIANYFFTGKAMYSSYPLLNSMLAETNYPCSRKATIVDEAKLMSVLSDSGLPSKAKVSCNEDGTFTAIDGNTYYTFSLDVGPA